MLRAGYAAILHAKWHCPNPAERIQDPIIGTEAEVVGDIVGELGREAGSEPVPAMNRQSELPLKGDRSHGSVGEMRAAIDAFALRHVLGDSATFLDRLNGIAR